MSVLGELFILMVGLEDAGDNLSISLTKSLQRWEGQTSEFWWGGDDEVGSRWYSRSPVVGYRPARVIGRNPRAGTSASDAGVAVVSKV